MEALSGAIVGAFNNIFVVHIEGGEVSGTIDESIRHAISKLSHFHFVTNEKAKQRLIQMGENNNNIYVVGSPDIDIMLSENLPTLSQVKKYYNIKFNEYSILAYHPVTTELKSIKQNTKILVRALEKSNDNVIVIYPNNDPGNEIIMQEYNNLKDNLHFKLFPSLEFESFLTLLKNAKYIIGNSSAGIMESGVYGIPAINIGNRQKGRYDVSKISNIQSIDYFENEILDAINNIQKYKIKNSPFGKGNSSEIIAKILLDNEIFKSNIQKAFYDLNIKYIGQEED